MKRKKTPDYLIPSWSGEEIDKIQKITRTIDGRAIFPTATARAAIAKARPKEAIKTSYPF